MRVECVLCEKEVRADDCQNYHLAGSKDCCLYKSKTTIEFLDSERKTDSPYMDVCRECFEKVLSKMRVLRYFKEVIKEDKKLSSMVAGKRKGY